MGFRNAAILTVALAGVVSAWQPSCAASGPEAMKALVGNTMMGQPPSGGAPFNAYFNGDGTVRSRQGKATHPSRWEFNGTQLCFLGAEPSSTRPKECYELDVTGDHGKLTSPREIITFQILPGNPENL